MALVPYLFFEGQCETALEYYKAAVGAEDVQLVRYKDAPDKSGHDRLPPGSDDKIMHACFTLGGARVFAADGMCTGKSNFQGFRLALEVRDKAEAEQRFHSLCEGGEVTMPLMETFWSPAFGMVTDKFGVGWMVMVPGAGA